MCGIAGMVDLNGSHPIPDGILQKMAAAIFHRGPDEDGYLRRPGVGLVNRRLSIVGLADGQQPIWNEDRTVVTVFNGEFFDYPEVRARLEARGHRFATHCDTEIIPHLWEDFQEGMFDHLRGQFAIALYDLRQRRIILARDRFGICPLFYTRVQKDGGDWLMFGSEIKALLASGWVDARPDLRGLDQVFNFFAVPGPATCFAGVTALQPGYFLDLKLGSETTAGQMRRRIYWSIDFPDEGQEERGDQKQMVDRFEKVFLDAVDRRLRADVPVVSYLSGGIDSSLVVAMACKIRGEAIPTFTIKIEHPHLDETSQAAVVSRHLGAKPLVVSVGDAEINNLYPELIRAAEAPVIDTSCVALLMLARAVHQQGYKVALTGEGSDEWLAGYAWYKVHRAMGFLDFIPGLPLSRWLRRGLLYTSGAPLATAGHIDRIRAYLGDHTPFQDLYAYMSQSRFRFFSPEVLRQLGDYLPYDDLAPDLNRIRRWDPLNRSFYWAGRIHLPGHLLSLKGDRVAMNSSVETRYPFLDEEVFSFLAGIDPKMKLHGFRDKYILRLLGERYLPREVAWRPKGMFRAPRDSFFDRKVPEYVNQLLSEYALRKTGYFNVAAVKTWQQAVFGGKVSIRKRASVELGLVGVLATQMWHQTFIDSSLADLPSWTAPTLNGKWSARPEPALVH